MLATIFIALIRLYQLTLSRLILATVGPVCRFEPSCSRYAVACIRGHGALRGSLLSAKRLCRCHPFHPGGYDPPPPPRNTTHPVPDAAPPEWTLPSSAKPPVGGA
jgi:putative membrane protein insertion efficiency factor